MKQVYTYLSMLYTQKLFIFFHIQIPYIRYFNGKEKMSCTPQVGKRILNTLEAFKCYAGSLIDFRKHLLKLLYSAALPLTESNTQGRVPSGNLKSALSKITSRNGYCEGNTRISPTW